MNRSSSYFSPFLWRLRQSGDTYLDDQISPLGLYFFLELKVVMANLCVSLIFYFYYFRFVSYFAHFLGLSSMGFLTKATECFIFDLDLAFIMFVIAVFYNNLFNSNLFSKFYKSFNGAHSFIIKCYAYFTFHCCQTFYKSLMVKLIIIQFMKKTKL